MRIPLIAFLVNKLGYEDHALPIDLLKGMNIAGEIPASRVLARRVAPAQRRLAALRNWLKTRNLGYSTAYRRSRAHW